MPDKTQDETLPLLDNGINKDEPPERRTRFRVSRLFLIPLFLIAFWFGGFVGLYFQPPGLQAFFKVFELAPGAGTQTPIATAIAAVESREEIAVVAEGDVVALGRIIPRGDVILVSPPFGSGDARIADLKVREGDVVNKGETLAVLDSLPQLKGAFETAKANVRVSEAALVQMRETIRASRAEAEASLARARASEAKARADLKRTSELVERGVSTRASLDEAIARADEAARDVDRETATLSRYATSDDGVQADIALSEANLLSAKAQMAQAERDLEKGYVRAPANGTVLDIHVREGERPDSEGLMDLGDTTQMTVEAEVYQTLIGRVAIGDPVTISANALDTPLKGSVTAIGLAIARQSITSDEPAANTDARVVDVIVTLEPESSTAAERFTNLQVITRIDAGRAVQ